MISLVVAAARVASAIPIRTGALAQPTSGKTVAGRASALHCFDQRAEIAVAGEQDHLVKMWSELQGIDRKLLDVHVALHLAPAGGVDEFLGRLGDDCEAVVIQPVDQRADRPRAPGP